MEGRMSHFRKTVKGKLQESCVDKNILVSCVVPPVATMAGNQPRSRFLTLKKGLQELGISLLPPAAPPAAAELNMDMPLNRLKNGDRNFSDQWQIEDAALNSGRRRLGRTYWEDQAVVNGWF
jgi:hypothetical protein